MGYIRKMSANAFLKYGLLILAAVIAAASIFPGMLGNLFQADQFLPHATCYLRNPRIILLHVTSDVLIGLSYVSISATLGYLVHKASRDIPFHWMFLAFGLFIITCGFTHFMEVLTVWTPLYWLAGFVKLICAAASVATAIALYPLVPKVFALIQEFRLSHQRRLELQTANRELEAFAYSVSHDLRAPLRAVRGMALALTEDYGQGLDPGAQQYLERIVTASNRMDSLVQDLLEYARISRTQFELTAVDLDRVLDQVQLLMREETEQAGAKIQVAGPMPAVKANATLLTQVLSNLLSNAIKFVAPGVKPSVRIEARELEGKVRVCVTDNGIGISPEYHGKVFRMFERLHSLNEYPGTGIGLTLVQKAVSRMNGVVGVDSAAGKGSTFWIELAKATP